LGPKDQYLNDKSVGTYVGLSIVQDNWNKQTVFACIHSKES